MKKILKLFILILICTCGVTYASSKTLAEMKEILEKEGYTVEDKSEEKITASIEVSTNQYIYIEYRTDVGAVSSYDNYVTNLAKMDNLTIEKEKTTKKDGKTIYKATVKDNNDYEYYLYIYKDDSSLFFMEANTGTKDKMDSTIDSIDSYLTSSDVSDALLIVGVLTIIIIVGIVILVRKNKTTE